MLIIEMLAGNARIYPSATAINEKKLSLEINKKSHGVIYNIIRDITPLNL